MTAASDATEAAPARARIALGRMTGQPPSVVVRSPGRVNLVGDHTDYNDGLALPMAINRELALAAAPRDDGTIRLVSEIDDVVHEHTVESIAGGVRWPSWTVYVQGVLREVPAGWRRGFDVAVASDVPNGAGLSSSAALEVGVGRLAAALAGRAHDPRRTAAWGVTAENEWVGVSTGVLDQLTVACGVHGHALVLDCRDHAIEPVRLPEDLEIVVLDTGARRDLVDSEYAARRRDCEQAAAALGVAVLRDLEGHRGSDDQAWWTTVSGWGELSERLQRRVRHVVTENSRVRAVAAALETGDAVRAGRLMTASHASLRDDYDVTGPELDTMAAVAADTPGVLGARMTGGGFAGAVVALVRRGRVDTDALLAAYRDHHDLPASAIVVAGVAGTSIVGDGGCRP